MNERILYRINLLPWRDQLIKEKNELFALTAVIIAIIVGVVVYGIFNFHNQQILNKENRLQFLQTNITNLKKDLESISKLDKKKKSLSDRIKIVDTLQEERPYTVRFFQELVRTLPLNGIWISNLSISENIVKVTGEADLPGRVAAYANSLGESNLFLNPTITNLVNNSASSLSTFDITITLAVSTTNIDEPPPL